MHENFTVCNCKQVSYFDIVDALNKLNRIEDAVSAFDDVQKVTHCSTGCGGCHDKVMKIISDTLYGYESQIEESCKR